MDILDTILSNTYTKADLNHRLALLREYLEYQFFTPHNNNTFIYLLNEFFVKKKESRDEFSTFMYWGPHFFEIFRSDHFHDELNSVAEKAENLPTVTIFLPVILPIYEIPKIGGWFRDHAHPKALMDIKFDRELIGGCALAWRGAYRDFSLRYYIERSKGEILKVLADIKETQVKKIV